MQTMHYILKLASSLCLFAVVLALFVAFDVFLIQGLGMSVEYSRVLHGFITGLYALENWCLLHDLEQVKSKLKSSPNHTYRTVQDDVISKLLVQNCRLEQQHMHMKNKLNKNMRKSYSLSMDTARPHQERPWGGDINLW